MMTTRTTLLTGLLSILIVTWRRDAKDFVQKIGAIAFANGIRQNMHAQMVLVEGNFAG